jgi:hypothetical protein
VCYSPGLSAATFDDTWDTHVDFETEGLRVLMETFGGKRVQLLEGKLLAHEGSELWPEERPANAPPKLTLIKFPARSRPVAVTTYEAVELE